MQSLSSEQINSKRDVSTCNDRPQTEDDAALRRAERALIARLKKTQKEIRRVDLFSAICAFFTLGLGLLLLGIVFDHWILPHGFSPRGRLFYAIFWIAATLIFFVAKLAPTFRRRVNPLYAAKILEEELQDDHNLTINWLQLCRGVKKDKKNNGADDWQDEAIREAVLREVTAQAVNKAREKKEEETSVDCSSLIRWGVALACVVAIGSGYVVCSSKNPFTSAQRIVAPFASIERPQALRFESVDPGDVVVYQGDFLDVTAEIPGADPSSVELLYSTEDRRLVDMAVPMEAQSAATFSAKIPNDELGFNENLTYQIVVGNGRQIESRSDTFHIEVKPQPSFRIEKTTLFFPAYTGLEPQTFENQGDVRALEGTQVEVVARANGQLERAFLLPDGSETRAQKMQISQESPYLATKRFELKLNGENAETVFDGVPQETSFYRVISQDVDGEKNRDVQDYSISVFSDLPPNIHWESAPEEQVEVPLNDVLRLKVWAEDPDFSLSSIQLTTSFNNLDEDPQKQTRSNPAPIELLQSKSSKTASYFVGPQVVNCEIAPEKLGLQVGDELEYWCVAFDSKAPEPNTAATEKLLLVVVDPVANPTGVVPQEEKSEEENDTNEDQSNQDGSGSGEGTGSEEQQENGENAESSDQNGEQDSEEGSSQNSEGSSGEESNQENNGESGESDNSNDGSQDSGEGENSDESESQNSDPNEQSGAEERSDGNNSASQGEQGPSATSRSEGSNSSEDQESSSEQGNEQSSNDSNGSSTSSDDPAERSNDQPNASQDPAASGSEQDSIDPETNPGDAFEKILDHMNQEKNSNDSNSQDDASSDDESTGSGGSSSSSPETDSEEDTTRESKEETSPDFQSDEDIPRPNEKKDLPTRTSSEKPKEGAPSYQANSPDKIDPNTKRRQDELDPETNDFLAQNADPQASESNPKSKNNDANVMFDPLDQSEGVAADSIDRNAQESKGAPNSTPSDAPLEVDDEQRNDEERQNDASNNSVPMDEIPQDALGGSGGSGNDDSSGKTSNADAQQGGANDDRRTPDEQSTKEGQGANGRSDQNAERQGGGGGSGMGEIGSGEQTLAPADTPKLQYAEQATNLVLDYLEESLKDKVDRELLDELGWTEEQLKEFLERWKKMRDDAFSDDESKEKYLKALQEMGLEEQPAFEDVSDVPSQGRKRDQEHKKSDGVREASRLKTPERLDERVRAFTRGVSKKNNDRDRL